MNINYPNFNYQQSLARITLNAVVTCGLNSESKVPAIALGERFGLISHLILNSVGHVLSEEIKSKYIKQDGSLVSCCFALVLDLAFDAAAWKAGTATKRLASIALDNRFKNSSGRLDKKQWVINRAIQNFKKPLPRVQLTGPFLSSIGFNVYTHLMTPKLSASEAVPSQSSMGMTFLCLSVIGVATFVLTRRWYKRSLPKKLSINNLKQSGLQVGFSNFLPN